MSSLSGRGRGLVGPVGLGIRGLRVQGLGFEFLINISLEVKLNCYKEEFLLPVDR